MAKYAPNRFFVGLILAGTSLSSCSESSSLASTRFLETNPDCIGVDLTNDARVQLFPQARFPKALVTPQREFRLDNATMIRSELFYLLLRREDTSHLLVPPKSVDDIYATWTYDVVDYSVSAI